MSGAWLHTRLSWFGRLSDVAECAHAVVVARIAQLSSRCHFSVPEALAHSVYLLFSGTKLHWYVAKLFEACQPASHSCLCDARECSMNSTTVKTLSTQMFSSANQLACVSCRLPLHVSSLLWLFSCFRRLISSCRSFDRHPSGWSSLTSLLGPLVSVRKLRLLFLTSSFVSLWLRCRRDCCGCSSADRSPSSGVRAGVFRSL